MVPRSARKLHSVWGRRPCSCQQTVEQDTDQLLACYGQEADSFVVCVCLFVWSLSSHSRIFHSYGDVTITVEKQKILTYMLGTHGHLSSEGSVATPTVTRGICL